VCLPGRYLQQPYRGPHRPHRHLHLSESGQCPPTYCPPRRYGVSPPIPSARLARGLSESPSLRLSPCELFCPACDHPPDDGAGTLACGRRPPAPAPATACGPLSALWRPDARRHAPVDLTLRLCRYQLRGTTLPWIVARDGVAHPRPPCARLPPSSHPTHLMA